MTEDVAVKELKRVDPQVVESIRNYLQESLEQFKVVGAGVAVIYQDEIILQEGFGLQDKEAELPVTLDTLFAIGSSTKAFTTMSVGMLVNEGKLDWDTPVISYLPDFRLHDKYATENATPRDMAAHRVGLPRHDLVWYKAPLSREELLKKLSYLPFTKPFRTTWQYQNLMYMALGCLVEQVSGASWENFVRERILLPLGMNRTGFTVPDAALEHDFSRPFKLQNDLVTEMPFAQIEAVGPAGSIYSSVADMVQWVRLQLDKGKFADQELIPESLVTDMHTPHISRGPAKDKRILFPSYGLGWFTEVYRGYHVVHHGGNIDGFTALVAMVPEEKLGVVILSNQNVSVMPSAAAYTIFDKVLGLLEVDWNSVMKDQFDKMFAALQNQEDGYTDKIPDTVPSHALADYTGDFEHPAYGRLNIAVEEGRLQALYHAFVKPLPLEHYHYDVFLLEIKDDVLLPPFKVQFLTNLHGQIDRVAIAFEAMLDPVEFTRVKNVGVVNTETWAAYIGDYDLAGMTATVARRGDDALVVTVPGQPTYELVPVSETEFELKGLPGFSVNFVLDIERTCGEVKFKQPNGTFTLKRK